MKRPYSILYLPFVLICTAFLISCITRYESDEGLKVYVLADYLHNGVLVQDTLPDGKYEYTYFSFVDFNYYYEGNTGSGDLFSALFTDATSAVHEGTYTGTLELKEMAEFFPYDQTPDAWMFRVPKENIEEAKEYIYADIIGNKGERIGQSKGKYFTYDYLESEMHWSSLYSCSHFTADVIQHMGINIRSSYYIYTNDILRSRLDKLTDRISF
jgi:hypothetical protein